VNDEIFVKLLEKHKFCPVGKFLKDKYEKGNLSKNQINWAKDIMKLIDEIPPYGCE
jgi:hypothetical protein